MVGPAVCTIVIAVTAVVAGAAAVVVCLAWLKARAARILDEDHARHD